MEGYRKALKIFPHNSNLYIDLGRCFEKHFKRIDMATVCYEKALELDPRNEWALNNVGAMLQKEGRWAEALSYYEVAYAVSNENNNHILHNLAWAHYHCKNYKKAWSLYSELIQDLPEEVSVYADLACVYYRLGWIEEALGLLNNVFWHYPKNRHCRRLYNLISKQIK
jgi:tetratricopeptide (TPR) repeat protein